MYECQYPNLFKPLKLGNTILRNRIFAAPTGYCDLTVENIATEPLMAYYESKARGGCAVVHVGEAYIDSVHGVDIPKYLKLDSDDCVSHLATVADAINKHGAIASIELMHAGMFASQSYIEGHQVWAPSDTVIKTDSDKASARLNGAFLPEMPEEEILNTIELYAQAAKRVQRAGFKMVLPSVYEPAHQSPHRQMGRQRREQMPVCGHGLRQNQRGLRQELYDRLPYVCIRGQLRRLWYRKRH